MIWTISFWKGAGERAIKTLFQTFAAVLVAGLGATAVGITAGLGDVSWLTALSVAGLAALLSLITSIGNASFTAGAEVSAPAVLSGNVYGFTPDDIIGAANDPDTREI